jgi:hypothetical protein
MYVSDLVITATYWTIWLSRNRKVFDDVELPVEVVAWKCAEWSFGLLELRSGRSSLIWTAEWKFWSFVSFTFLLISSSGVMAASVKIVVRTSKDKEPTGATTTGPWTEATNSGDHSLTGLTGVRDDIDLPCWIQQPVSPNWLGQGWFLFRVKCQWSSSESKIQLCQLCVRFCHGLLPCPREIHKRIDRTI